MAEEIGNIIEHLVHGEAAFLVGDDLKMSRIFCNGYLEKEKKNKNIN